MPRDGSGVASPVAGTNTASSGTVIQSTLNNSNINDIYQLMNTAWPVSLGGTGGTTQITSWDALSARGTDVATAATVNLTTATGPDVNLTGTTTITAITLADKDLRFARVVTGFSITASATLVVNGQTVGTFALAAEDRLLISGYGSSTVRVTRIGGSLFPNGTAALPSISFVSDDDTGLYHIGANELGVALGGAVAWDFAASNTSYTWVDAGAAVGPVIELFRDSASPATSDFLGGISFTGRNASAAKTTYAQLASTINTATAGSEIGQLTLKLVNTGTVASYYIFDPSAILPLGSGMGNGSAGFPWGSLDLATGGLIRFGATNVQLVHSSGALSLLGATAALLDLSDSTAGQIKFPASQHASANANTLDDYKEQTFTPGMTFNGSATGVTTSVATGIDTAIGNVVSYGVQITLTSNGSGVGTALVTGMPYSASTLAIPAAFNAISGFSGLTAGVSGTVTSTTITMRAPNTTGSAALSDTNVTDTAAFLAGGIYFKAT